METLVYIILFFVLGVSSAVRAFHWFLTPKDELYSDYRNTIDISKEDFNRRLIKKRAIWGIITIMMFAGLLYLFTK